MIISVGEFKQYYNTTESDSVIGNKLSAMEMMIRKYTNNNFQNRKARCISAIKDGVILAPSIYFKVGDTLQIEDELYTLTEGNILSPVPFDSENTVITRIEYPIDIKMGVVNLMKWNYEHGDKIGVSSESISRHSVSYFNMEGSLSTIGFPPSLIGFLKPYMKARF